ncbi:MAG TPA: 50S ribosomal protein L20 [Bdellovibrionota bacterium]|nr:50S ribosomal protein L20 [Bdellovibrionota bacterium]
MPRVKGGSKQRQRHKKVLNATEGFRNSASRSFKKAAEALNRSLNYAFRDRKAKKRDFRGLWIQRINAAARINGLSYSALIAGLKKSGIEIDRKVLADLAVSDPKGFAAITQAAKSAN